MKHTAKCLPPWGKQQFRHDCWTPSPCPLPGREYAHPHSNPTVALLEPAHTPVAIFITPTLHCSSHTSWTCTHTSCYFYHTHITLQQSLCLNLHTHQLLLFLSHPHYTAAVALLEPAHKPPGGFSSLWSQKCQAVQTFWLAGEFSIAFPFSWLYFWRKKKVEKKLLLFSEHRHLYSGISLISWPFPCLLLWPTNISAHQLILYYINHTHTHPNSLLQPAHKPLQRSSFALLLHPSMCACVCVHAHSHRHAWVGVQETVTHVNAHPASKGFRVFAVEWKTTNNIPVFHQSV